tara:strand:+ start:1168 stop:2535 length:1368 start_codon:yes stop_codon:yes gene_type:complete
MAYTTTPGIPSAFQVATSENYVSTLSLHKPEVAEDFVSRYGDQSLMGFLDSVGAMAPVSQRKFEHYEDDWLHQNFTAAAVTIAAAGTSITMANASSSNAAADGSFFLRKGDIVQNKHGEIALCTVRSTTDATATLVPYKNAAWTPMAASDIYIIIGNEHEEGTGQPKGITPTANHYENNTMILKDSFEVTGSEATNKIWFKVNDAATGKSGYLWYLKGEGDTYKRFNNYCETQMLLGQVATNTNLPGTIGAGGISGTEGLVDFMRSGNSQTYTAGAFGTAQFDTMIKALDAQKGAKENTIWAGLDLSLDIDDSMMGTAQATNGGVQYGAFNGNKEIALAFGFSSFSRGGYTFHKKIYDTLSYSPMMGATGFDYAGMGLVIPGDAGRDAKTRESIPSLRVRYKEAGGYSRKMEHWLTGSAGLANPTNDEDNMKAHYRTERGFEGFANNRFALIELV